MTKMDTPHLCECGCGRPTAIAWRNSRRSGVLKGEPYHYLVGHRPKKYGAAHPSYRGGTIDHDGYRRVRHRGQRRMEHVVLAERALGRPLPPKAQVHHVNEDRADNSPDNLVICEDQPYHRLLHRRRASLLACGNPNWARCRICGRYDDPANLRFGGKGEPFHADELAAHLREYDRTMRRVAGERVRQRA